MPYLLYVAQASGLILILGALFLLWKEKIFLDAETKEILFIELPWFGKLRTNAPSFALFVFGLAAIIYPIYLTHTQYIKVKQHISSDAPPVVIYAVVQERSILNNDEDYELDVPILNTENYEPQLLYFAGSASSNALVDLQTQKQGVIKLDPKIIRLGGQVKNPPVVVTEVIPKPNEFK